MTSAVEAGPAATSPQRPTFIKKHPVVTAAILASLAVTALLLSWFFAAVPLTGVEPGGNFIDCGPALIGRPSPLPHPTCADAYGGVVIPSLFFGLAAAASLVGSVWLLARTYAHSRTSD